MAGEFGKPVVGIEPTTRALRMRCSTTELHRRYLGVEVIARKCGHVKRRGSGTLERRKARQSR
jgi:hypothetical protein